MKKNVGNLDKILRVFVAAILIVLYYMGIFNSEVLAIVALLVAGVLVITSLLNFCPLYFVFGIKSKRKNTEIID
jgi:hypothetical protein